MSQQSLHTELMTIIYLINQSTNKLFNEICNSIFAFLRVSVPIRPAAFNLRGCLICYFSISTICSNKLEKTSGLLERKSVKTL